MAIKVTCDECSESFSVKDEAAGKRIKCKACGAAVSVPVKGDDDDWLDEVAPARPAAPRRGPARPAPRASSGGVPAWLWIVLGGGGALILLCGGILFAFMRRGADPQVPNANNVPGQPPAIVPPAGAPGMNSPASVPNVPWTASPDPATAAIEWPASWPSSITVNDPYPTIVFPSRPSRFVAINLGKSSRGSPTVYDAASGEKKGSLKANTGDAGEYALSPDGKYLIELSQTPKRGVPELSSFDTGDKIALSGLGETIVTADFGAPGKALFWSKDKKLSVVDTATGKAAQSAATIEPDEFLSVMAVSPGSKYVALGGKKGLIQIVEIATVRVVGQMSLPGDLSSHTIYNLAFSPDGSRLATVVYELDKTTFVLCDMKAGKLEVAFSIPGDLSKSIDKTYSYKGADLEWLPDGKGWLLYGALVVEESSKQVVWQFPYPSEEIIPTTRHAAGSAVLALAQGTAGRTIKGYEIPWPRITEALTSATPAAAYFGTGVKVRLQFQLGALVNGGVADPTKALVEQGIRKRLANQRIEVDDADASLAILRINYEEKVGPQMEFRKLGAPFNSPATVIPSTNAVVTISVLAPDGAKSLYSNSIKVDAPSFLMNADPTAAGLRQKTLDGVKSRLESAPLPIYIPKDPNAISVPGTTVVN